MNIWITLLALIASLYTGVPQHAFGAHHTLDRRQAPGQAPRARPGFRLVRARLRSSTTSTTAAPDDYYYYEVPEDSQTAPPPPASRFRGRVVARTRGRPPQKGPGPNPIPPPPSYEEELSHYGYNFGPPKQGNKLPTSTTTTTTTTAAPTDPPRTLSPNYKQRADGRIIDFLADPNFPRELKGSDLTDYPFYENLPEDIDFDCGKWHDGFYASIKHKCQLFHYCFGALRYDFLCPNYTLYDQTTFTCRFINSVECEKSEKHYDRNEALYKETTTVPPSTKAPPPPPPPRKKPPKKKLVTTTPASEEYDEYEYEDETTTTLTTTTTTTAKPKRRRLRPRLRIPGSRGPQQSSGEGTK
ncbi:unnamed protein product [Ixodes persulcatus]